MKLNARTYLVIFLLAGAIAGLPGLASASGFSLLEQSARSLGRAHSGGAALVNDPSAIFYNPAGLTSLTQAEFMGSLSYVDLQADFTKTYAFDAAGRPISGPEAGGTQKAGLVPALFFGAPINDRWAWGIGVYVPFGLNTDYPADWVGRYQAVYSSVAGVNFTPAVAYEINDVWSVGFGITVEYFKVKLTSMLDYGAICYGNLGPVSCMAIGLTPQSHDGYFGVEGDDTAVGWTAGVHADFGSTRIGFNYNSSVEHDIEGTARFEAVPAIFAAQGVFRDGPVTSSIETPARASLSFAQALNDDWTISGDVTWMGWSSFDAIVIDFANPRQDTTKQPEKWQNTWRYSVGVDWQYSHAWTFRGGLAYDQTAIQDEYRTARLPGDDRKWIALGATWHFGALDLDFGYSHLFVGDEIPVNEPTRGAHLVGTYEVATDIVSIGLRYTF